MKKRKQSKKKSNKGFFKTNFNESILYIKESRNFIYTIVLVFALSIILGAFLPVPKEVYDKILQFIAQLVDETKGMSWAELTKFLFLNNSQSSFVGMIFGVFLGLFPVFTAFFNGYLLGFVALKAVGVGGVLVLWKLFPHGIFEVPALLISLGLGLKLGTFVFQKDKIKSLKSYLINTLRVFFFVVIPLLLIAAIIEGTLITLVG